MLLQLMQQVESNQKEKVSESKDTEYSSSAIEQKDFKSPETIVSLVSWFHSILWMFISPILFIAPILMTIAPENTTRRNRTLLKW